MLRVHPAGVPHKAGETLRSAVTKAFSQVKIYLFYFVNWGPGPVVGHVIHMSIVLCT